MKNVLKLIASVVLVFCIIQGIIQILMHGSLLVLLFAFILISFVYFCVYFSTKYPYVIIILASCASCAVSLFLLDWATCGADVFYREMAVCLALIPIPLAIVAAKLIERRF